MHSEDPPLLSCSHRPCTPYSSEVPVLVRNGHFLYQASSGPGGLYLTEVATAGVPRRSDENVIWNVCESAGITLTHCLDFSSFPHPDPD